MKLYDKNIKNKLKSKNRYQVTWTSTRRVLMAAPGAAGGKGGGGGASAATTRINVIDPHIVQMMRDVMSSAESAQRLYPNAGAGGGGGGGGGEGSGTGADGYPRAGETTSDGPDADRCIVIIDGAEGGNGLGAQSGTNVSGGGGGGAGGTGGAMVIITTTPQADINGSLNFSGGLGGYRGASWQTSENGNYYRTLPSGSNGLLTYIQV